MSGTQPGCATSCALIRITTATMAGRCVTRPQRSEAGGEVTETCAGTPTCAVGGKVGGGGDGVERLASRGELEPGSSTGRPNWLIG